MKKLKYPINHKHIEELKLIGYTVQQKSPWHFRVSFELNMEMNDELIYVDFFPTTHTYTIFKNGFFSKGKSYKDIRCTCEEVLEGRY